MIGTKPFNISKHLVVKAFQLVKAKAGSAGIDNQSIADFEKDLKDNLYKLWNRLSSGSYFPPPVKAVPIPKKTGGKRILGVPTITDRIAQMVVKLTFEPSIEPYFHKDSYGYRPNKSALDAIGITRQRCWQYNYVLEYDIKGLFDNLDHDLLLKAVTKHTDNKWVILYIKRWLKAHLQLPDGTLQARNKGVPQGGVISPCLSNLFLHYVFDSWMVKKYPENLFCRYADDGLVHCKTESQAQQLLIELRQRFWDCGLELHPDKTKVVYCKDNRRKGEYPNTAFEFLGYSFCRKGVQNNKDKSIFMGFIPAVSKSAQKSMRSKTRSYKFYRRADMSLSEIAKQFNPVIRGWIEYYGRYTRHALSSVFGHFNKTLIAWARNKYKKLRSKIQARSFIQSIMKREPHLFVHWKIGIFRWFA